MLEYRGECEIFCYQNNNFAFKPKSTYQQDPLNWKMHQAHQAWQSCTCNLE